MKKVIIGIVIFILTVGLSGCVTDNAKRIGKESLEMAQTEEDLLAKVKTLMTLPEEIPTINYLEDEKQKPQDEFFADLQKDDYILTFSQANLVVIYRERENRIIKYGTPNNAQPKESIPNSSTKPKEFTPVAVSGAIITDYSQDGRVTFDIKCDRCNKIDGSLWFQLSEAKPIDSTYHHCQDCNLNQKVEIRGIFTPIN